jgi:hypothetical protein
MRREHKKTQLFRSFLVCLGTILSSQVWDKTGPLSNKSSREKRERVSF